MKRITLAVLALVLLLGLSAQAQTVKKVSAASGQGPIFPKGNRAPADHFTGLVYTNQLVPDDSTFNCLTGNVTFEPGGRTYWHSHPAGHILLITEGTGYYQEKGQPIRLVHKGAVIKTLPGVEHWHGASLQQGMTHIAIHPNTEKGLVTWLRPVTDQEYRSFK